MNMLFNTTIAASICMNGRLLRHTMDGTYWRRFLSLRCLARLPGGVAAGRATAWTTFTMKKNCTPWRTGEHSRRSFTCLYFASRHSPPLERSLCDTALVPRACWPLALTSPRLTRASYLCRALHSFSASSAYRAAYCALFAAGLPRWASRSDYLL